MFCDLDKVLRRKYLSRSALIPHQPMRAAAAASLPLDLGDLFPFFQGEFNPAFSTNEFSHLFNTHLFQRDVIRVNQGGKIFSTMHPAPFSDWIMSDV